jgi:hypothetical protein
MVATSDVAVFASVVFVAVGVGVVGAVVAGLRGRGAYDRIGGGGPDVGARPDGDAAAEIAELEDALRRRRAARGVEVAPSPADPGLEDELRQLAQARNARRARAGLEPLDVEAEVARRIRAHPER